MIAALKLSACAVALALFSGCQSLPENPPQTVQSVDLQRYTGLWYELARMPVPFQKDNEQATAEYTLNQKGTVDLINTAIAPDGSTRSVTGTAVPVDASNNTKLKVTIDNFFAKLFGSPPDYGNYWVLKLADDYSIALVGSPSRKALWLLARTPEVPEATLNQYLEHAHDQGYEIDTIIINNGAF
jgi:apolipoprotein D and lipocalin family protein